MGIKKHPDRYDLGVSILTINAIETIRSVVLN